MSGIHPTAIIHPGAQLGEGVEIGPYSVVGPNVRLGDRSVLMSHVVLDGVTTIGCECHIYPFACLGTLTQDRKYKPGNRVSMEIGDRTTIREYVTINSGTNDGEITKVGSDCLILAYCHVAHACKVGNHVTMTNGATLAGEVVVEDECILAGYSGVHQFCRIGRLSMLGAMVKVTQDVPPFMLVAGTPPEVPGPNTVGMSRRGLSTEAQSAIKLVHRLLYRSGLSTSQAVEKIKAEVPMLPEVEYVLQFIAASQRGILK
jgi:UDP-N-acetylglucosamine acyltransferase